MGCSAESRRRNPTPGCAGAEVGLSLSVGATALRAAFATLLNTGSLTLRCLATASDERLVNIVAFLYLPCDLQARGASSTSVRSEDRRHPYCKRYSEACPRRREEKAREQSV